MPEPQRTPAGSADQRSSLAPRSRTTWWLRLARRAPAGMALLACALLVLAAADLSAQAADASLDAWRDHIRPGEAERAWEQLGWHASFADGLLAADAARRPLLLWMMNGHPLGCT